MIHAGRLKPYLGPALGSWILEVGETSTPVVSQAGMVVLNRVSHVISGPVSFVARGSEPSRSVVTGVSSSCFFGSDR